MIDKEVIRQLKSEFESSAIEGQLVITPGNIINMTFNEETNTFTNEEIQSQFAWFLFARASNARFEGVYRAMVPVELHPVAFNQRNGIYTAPEINSAWGAWLVAEKTMFGTLEAVAEFSYYNGVDHCGDVSFKDSSAELLVKIIKCEKIPSTKEDEQILDRFKEQFTK